MAATVKCDTVVNAASATNNLALDTSGNVTIGNNLTVTGTTTQTGVVTLPAGTAAAPALTRTGDTDTGVFFPATNTLGFSTNGTEDARFDQYGSLLVGTTTSPTTTTGLGTISAAGTVVMGSSFLRNRIINGAMAIDQRNAGASLSSGGGIVYCVDRWWFGSNGAATTAQRVAGSGSTQYRLQITGAASVTSVLLGQRIEAANSYDLAGSTVTLSFDMANSLLTSASWTLSYANSTDSFGTLASPTITTISSGLVNITSTVTRYSVQISIPAAATTGLQIQFGAGAQTSGTWTIGNVQLEVGSVATPFERRQYGQELALCQRYCIVYSAAIDTSVRFSGYAYTTTSALAFMQFPVTLRTPPTGISVSTASNFTVYTQNGTTTVSSITFDNAGCKTANVAIATGTISIGQGIILSFNNAANKLEFTGTEL